MRQLLAGLVFVGFVLVGLLFATRGQQALPTARRKAAVSAFLWYALIASFTAGLTQKNLWPFSPWPLIAGVIPSQVQEMHFVGLDTAGMEHEIDYRAWEPMAFRELGAWLTRVFPHLDHAAQDRAAAYLVHKAEMARQGARAGQDVGYLDRFLGPLTAPYFILHPRFWADRDSVPSAPLVGLRMYYVTWDVVARARGSLASTRTFVYEYPRR